MKKIYLSIIFFIILNFSMAIYFYPAFPEEIASHWGIRGEVNGYMPKFTGLFFIPFLTLSCVILFFFLPKIDPMRKNLQEFRAYYDLFILIFVFFMFYIFSLTLLWNLGFRFNMLKLLIPGMSLLFYYTGVLLKNCKQNWFIGIRTPWTLSSKGVWEKTHSFGGKAFKLAGFFSLLGLIFDKYAFFFLMIPIILMSIITVFYSYILYKKMKK